MTVEVCYGMNKKETRTITSTNSNTWRTSASWGSLFNGGYAIDFLYHNEHIIPVHSLISWSYIYRYAFQETLNDSDLWTTENYFSKNQNK